MCCTGCRRRCRTTPGGPAEPRRRRGLHDAAHLGEGPPRPHVRVLGRLVGVEHRREAGVGALEQRAPLVARPRPHQRGHARLHRGPRRRGRLVGDRSAAVDVVGQPDAVAAARRTTASSIGPERDVAGRRPSRRPRRTRRRCRAGSCPARPTARRRAGRASSRPAARRRRPSPRRPPGPGPTAPPRAIPQTIPNASSMPPPPKSPTRLSGGTGGSPARPIIDSVPDSAT